MATYRSHGAFEDSDADDEYERSAIASPTLPADYHSSPTDSESLSTEHTPTSYSHRDNSPHAYILDWDPEQVADFIDSLGLHQYADSFADEAIRGDSLITLLHAELKEIGIASIGHRLTILKGIYDVKIKQGVPVEADHFVPRTAEPEIVDPPSHEDFSTIIRILKDRDVVIQSLREAMDRLQDENKKLREDVLPLIKQAKDRSHPLPTPEERDFAAAQAPEVVKTGSNLSRKFSTKRLFLSNGGPKNPSPTAIPENHTLAEVAGLNPSAAALAASHHLTASLRDAASPNQAVPSPTSPAYQIAAPSSTGPTQRGFARNEPLDRDGWNSTFTSGPDPRSRAALDPPLSAGSQKTAGPTSGSIAPQTATTPNSASGSGSSAPSKDQVEIFKSFRVSIDDPCHKVLPVALKKYNITADWRQYALYIVHGDQERCLGLNEKPLILFKQLDREGRKPMFMLRKHATPVEGHYSVVGQNSGTVQIPGGII